MPETTAPASGWVIMLFPSREDRPQEPDAPPEDFDNVVPFPTDDGA